MFRLLGFLVVVGAMCVLGMMGYHSYTDCVDLFKENRDMLSEDVCTDAKKRARYESRGLVDCKKMQLQLELGVVHCAMDRVWESFFLREAWVILKEHKKLLIFGAVLLAFFTVYLRHIRHRERDDRNQKFREQWEPFRMLLQGQQMIGNAGRIQDAYEPALQPLPRAIESSNSLGASPVRLRQFTEVDEDDEIF